MNSSAISISSVRFSLIRFLFLFVWSTMKALYSAGLTDLNTLNTNSRLGILKTLTSLNFSKRKGNYRIISFPYLAISWATISILSSSRCVGFAMLMVLVSKQGWTERRTLMIYPLLTSCNLGSYLPGYLSVSFARKLKRAPVVFPHFWKNALDLIFLIFLECD